MKTNKIGIVPYHSVGSGRAYLVHLPKPKNEGEEAQMKWGVARGTLRYRGDDGQWQDIKYVDMLDDIPRHKIEEHWHTALHEAQEELGVTRQDLDLSSVEDHGMMDYASETKVPYPIHWFSVKTKASFTSQVAKERAIDSLDIGFKTLDEIEAMVQSDSVPNAQFKAGYLPILKAIDQKLA
ncbi:MAG: hypothetical protein MRY32_04325 [Rickettsiales bacterium]|nr:hypothetical protein [Rickettsiales bacterium]